MQMILRRQLNLLSNTSSKQVDVMVEDPEINVPENVEYIVSVTIK